jgi:endogenous inhibitor of DNA gyrase (YacG/DUF329 family)
MKSLLYKGSSIPSLLFSWGFFSQVNKMKTSCPICRKAVEWEGNRFRPFCSERCKLIDLGNWATESYRVPSTPEEEEEEGQSGGPAEEGEGPLSDGSSDRKQNGKPDRP